MSVSGDDRNKLLWRRDMIDSMRFSLDGKLSAPVNPPMQPKGNALTAKRFLTRVTLHSQDNNELKQKVNCAAENLAENFVRHIDWCRRVWIGSVVMVSHSGFQPNLGRMVSLFGSFDVSLVCTDVTEALHAETRKRFNEMLSFTAEDGFFSDRHSRRGLDVSAASTAAPYKDLPFRMFIASRPPMATAMQLADPASLLFPSMETSDAVFGFSPTLLSHRLLSTGESLSLTRIAAVRQFVAFCVLRATAHILADSVVSGDVSFVVGLQDFVAELKQFPGQTQRLYGLVGAIDPRGNNICASLIPHGSDVLNHTVKDLEPGIDDTLIFHPSQCTPFAEGPAITGAVSELIQRPPKPVVKRPTIRDLLDSLNSDTE